MQYNVCTMYGHHNSNTVVRINRVRLPILLVVSRTRKMNISLSPFAPGNLVSWDGFGSHVPRQSASLHTQAESGPYLWDSFRVPRRRPFIYLNRHTPVPSSSGHAIAYRSRTLPRVRRHRASKPQGSSSNGCCLCITTDQLICAFRSHTLYRYEVGILKVTDD